MKQIITHLALYDCDINCSVVLYRVYQSECTLKRIYKREDLGEKKRSNTRTFFK